jgi:hypothetical protein
MDRLGPIEEDRVGLMVHHCEHAERELRAARPLKAVAQAQLAGALARSEPDRAEAQVSVRAMLAEVDGLELADRLDAAQARAFDALAHAVRFCPRERWHALAALRLSETLEVQRRYDAAADGFAQLEQETPEDWGADIKLWSANHMISIGVHTANRYLQDEGIRRGAAVRALVSDSDQVASYLQWRGIAESRRYEPEKAEATFNESFGMRDDTTRREITKRFLVAEIAYAHGDQDAGDRRLRSALETAERHGLARHARAARDHFVRYQSDLA